MNNGDRSTSPSSRGRLRVALDVSALNAQPSGIGHYALNLANAIGAATDEIDLHLVSHRDLRNFPALAGVFSKQPYCFPVRALWMQLLLPTILKKIDPHLCHFTNSLAPLSMRYPYTITIHDMSLSLLPSYHMFPKRYYSRALIPTVARKAKEVITVSERSRHDIQRILGISKARIHAIPLAAEPMFQPVRDPVLLRQVLAKYDLQPPYLLFVGTLEPRKNLSRLLRAFAPFSRIYRDCTLCLIGQTGWKQKDLGHLITSLGLRDRVSQLGYVARHDLPALYSGAKFLVYPSLLEGFGLPVLEAMSCGTPVLISSGSCLEEVAGNTAVYVDPWEIDSILNGMRRMAEDRELCHYLSQSGLDRSRLFSWPVTARKTLEVYRQVVAGAASSMGNCTFRLRMEMDAPVSPRKESYESPGHDFSAQEWAILKTVVYASLFRYPLTAEELAWRLFELELSSGEVEESIHGSNLLDAALEKTGSYIHLRGRQKDVELRSLREGFTRAELQRERLALKWLCRMPWVLMVCLSGATAHANMDEGDDLDLMLVVRGGRLWLFFAAFTLLAKMLGKRRKLCANYVLSDRLLALPLNDFFSADQLLNLKPLCGDAYYREILRLNPWIDDHYPGRRQHLLGLHEDFRPPRCSHEDGLLARLDRCMLRLYGTYLMRKSRDANADLDLSSLQIKAHLQSHRQDVGMRFQKVLAEVLSGVARRKS